MENPSLYGIRHSNRDFTNKNTWGKNQFNSSFPASLAAYLAHVGLDNVYLRLNDDLKIEHSLISTSDLYGIDSTSEDLFYSFESAYTPYAQLLIGHLPRVDLVTQRRSDGQALRPLEIKLTALPDIRLVIYRRINTGRKLSYGLIPLFTLLVVLPSILEINRTI